MNKIKLALRITGYILTGILLVFSVLLFTTCNWSKKTFNVGLQEILFTIKSPLIGSDPEIIMKGIEVCLVPVVIVFGCYIAIAAFDIKIKTQIYTYVTTKYKMFRVNIRKILRYIVAILTIITFISSFVNAENQYQVIEFVKNSLDATTIYEDYYIHPDSVNLRADGDEKNLICIYLESMETTYASKDEGGAQTINYMPNLTKLANENISFSDSDKLGGFRPAFGTTWTAGALMSTTSGIPFSFPTEGNSMNLRENFASGLTNLGDVLDSFGYNQYFLCGSDAEFGGRKTYFKQHGNYNIIDLYTAREKGYIAQDYYVFWGFEDKHLYDIAKCEITNAYNTGVPFNFTMLTVDTHFPDGYVCELCKSDYESIAANVVSCADRQISEFVEWCKNQSFYEDTVIIILGDHPRMDTNLTENVEYLNRTIYNCFINCEENSNINAINRDFTPMDMLPTTLSAMGFEFDGNRIGLGTDMFSGEFTLAEELGFEYFNEEISKYSQYYLDNFS